MTNSKSIALNPRNPKEIVLAIGGRNNIEIGANYEFLTQPWKKIKARHNMPVKRSNHGIGLVNNIMYLFGGYWPLGFFFFEIGLYQKATFAFDTIKKVSKYSRVLLIV